MVAGRCGDSGSRAARRRFVSISFAISIAVSLSPTLLPSAYCRRRMNRRSGILVSTATLVWDGGAIAQWHVVGGRKPNLKGVTGAKDTIRMRLDHQRGIPAETKLRKPAIAFRERQ